MGGWGLAPNHNVTIMTLIYIKLVEYKLWCIPKHSRILQMKLLYLGVVGHSAGGPNVVVTMITSLYYRTI